MASLKDERPVSLVARVVVRADEITAARRRGVTWPRIVQLIGDEVGLPPNTPAAAQRMRQAHAAAIKAIATGRLAPAPAAANGNTGNAEANGKFRPVGGMDDDAPLPPFGSNFEQL